MDNIELILNMVTDIRSDVGNFREDAYAAIKKLEEGLRVEIKEVKTQISSIQNNFLDYKALNNERLIKLENKINEIEKRENDEEKGKYLVKARIWGIIVPIISGVIMYVFAKIF